MVFHKTCPVCSSKNTQTFLTRRDVPIHQNLVYSDQNEAISIKRGTLQLANCIDCGFIYNQTFEPEKLAYGKYYDNTQMCSSIFNQYIQERINHLIYEKNVQNCCIVDIGCGKGEFLEELVQNPSWCNQGFGFDPSYIGPATKFDGRLQFYRTIYDDKVSIQQVDVIICRHVIEHISNPFEFLRDIQRTLRHSPNAKIFFETPDVEWILHNQVIWDFFYEHCSYFTKHSLSTLFQRAGFEVNDIKQVFGQQYLWLEASLARTTVEISKDPNNILDLALQFSQMENHLLKIWLQRLESLQDSQNIAIWGAGAKGATFANLLDRDRTKIDSVIDLNPRKQDMFLPGTGHPIIDYQNIVDRNINIALLMNPNYREENLNLLSKMNIDIPLIDLMDDKSI